MYKHEVGEFANYEVYDKTESGEVETICVCGDREMATIIAKTLAMAAKRPNTRVYVTGVYHPGSLIPGGGWYDAYWRDGEGKLRSGGLG